MKDHNMTEQAPEEFFADGKESLDKCIRRIAKLADGTFEMSLACCANFDLDARDGLGDVSGHLSKALGELKLARAAAGRIDDGGMTRSGGT